MTTFTSWDTELYHHGIKGQKWGIRRFQNPDGSLTAAGQKRYEVVGSRQYKKALNSDLKALRKAGAENIKAQYQLQQARSSKEEDRYKRRLQKSGNTVNTITDRLAKETDRASEKGYNVSGKYKDVKIRVASGRDYVKSILRSGAISGLLTASANYKQLAGYGTKQSQLNSLAAVGVGTIMGGLIGAGITRETSTRYAKMPSSYKIKKSKR